MTDVIGPQHVAVRYDVETVYGDGAYDDDPCTGYNPDWLWIGTIDDVVQGFTNNKLENRGIGSVDPNAFSDGLQSPEITLKYKVQRYSVSAPVYNPATFLAMAKTFGVGLTMAWEATYGLVASPTYMTMWYKGMQIDSLDIDLSIDSYIIATVKLVGHSVVDATALIVGDSREANPLTATKCLPLTGLDAEVFLNAAGGADTPLTEVKKVHLSIKNYIQRVPTIQTTNSQYLKYLIKGKRELTGELTLYVEDKTELAHLLDATNLDLRVDLNKTDNTPYFDFTGVKFDTGQLTTRINEIPCEITLPFKATGITIA